MRITTRATVDELYRIEGKAELVDGEIVSMSPPGGWPGYAGDEIFASLHAYSKRTRTGRAVGDHKAFWVTLPNRESLSPDAACYTGPDPGMKLMLCLCSCTGCRSV
ncbi:MAG: hypothetical protein FJZ47_01140 [Candidatus Tectomicrobia bacterium]|uniref:Putative restriction endonuclease domain-containing protein n=1 Tax=Tectimicrobiota bacterium TaxID=2528274 RepID=A0A937VZ55_UNCTE|nr:hypothetical protein [Candidatus Tectomicrobia bacterium]